MDGNSIALVGAVLIGYTVFLGIAGVVIKKEIDDRINKAFDEMEARIQEEMKPLKEFFGFK